MGRLCPAPEQKIESNLWKESKAQVGEPGCGPGPRQLRVRASTWQELPDLMGSRCMEWCPAWWLKDTSKGKSVSRYGRREGTGWREGGGGGGQAGEGIKKKER